MSNEVAARLARLVLGFEDAAARIRAGAETEGLGSSEVRLMLGIVEGETGARALSRRMGLDEGHVSRIVRRLSDAGFLTRTPYVGEARRKELALTDAGRLRLARSLERASSAAEALTEQAGAKATDALVSALEEFAGNGGGDLELTGLAPGDGGWVIERHAALYARDEAFDATFEVAVARIVADFIDRGDTTRERAFIARRDGRRLGCAFCTAADGASDVAQLRLFLVVPEARRTGVGRRLLDACRDFAASAGYCRLILHTHAEHTAACALYAAEGFTLEKSFPVVAYGRRMEEQVWSIPLCTPLAKGARQS